MPINELFEELLGSAFGVVSDYVRAAAPKCNFCGDIGIPCSCGHAACKSHIFVNVAYRRTICADCAESLGVMFDDMPPEYDDYDDEEEYEPRVRPRARAKRRAAPASPGPSPKAVKAAFALMELDPATAEKDDVNKAFRRISLDCHPDMHPNDAKAARRFQGLQKAKEICLITIGDRV